MTLSTEQVYGLVGQMASLPVLLGADAEQVREVMKDLVTDDGFWAHVAAQVPIREAIEEGVTTVTEARDAGIERIRELADDQVEAVGERVAEAEAASRPPKLSS